MNKVSSLKLFFHSHKNITLVFMSFIETQTILVTEGITMNWCILMLVRIHLTRTLEIWNMSRTANIKHFFLCFAFLKVNQHTISTYRNLAQFYNVPNGLHFTAVVNFVNTLSVSNAGFNAKSLQLPNYFKGTTIFFSGLTEGNPSLGYVICQEIVPSSQTPHPKLIYCFVCPIAFDHFFQLVSPESKYVLLLVVLFFLSVSKHWCPKHWCFLQRLVCYLSLKQKALVKFINFLFCNDPDHSQERNTHLCQAGLFYAYFFFFSKNCRVKQFWISLLSLYTIMNADLL